MALQFLQRAQISGADADNYTAVRNWLMMIANGNLVVTRPAPAEDAKKPEAPQSPPAQAAVPTKKR